MLVCGFIAANILSAEPSAADISWKKGTERFYSFDFVGSPRYFREAVREGKSRDQKLEYQYWLAKALWIRILDQQTDINNDFITAAIERVNISAKLVDDSLRNEFLTVTKTGVDTCQHALKQSPDDLNALYFLAAFRSNEAAYRLIVEQRQFAALSSIKACIQMFRQVLAKDPSRLQMLSLLGLTHYMIGSNPWYVRAMSPLFGLEGTRAEGIAELERASRAGSVDATFVLKSALVKEGRLNDALPLLEELSALYPMNLAFVLQKGQILATLGQTEKARAAFREVLGRVRNGEAPDPRFTPLRVQELARAANVAL